MTDGSPYIVLLIFTLLVIVPAAAQEKVGAEGGEASETILAVSTEDSTTVIQSDSLAIAAGDSLRTESDTRGNLVQSLLTPIVITAFVGGIVYLIFTQRGR